MKLIVIMQYLREVIWSTVVRSVGHIYASAILYISSNLKYKNTPMT